MPSRLEFEKFAAFIKVDGQELACHALSVDQEKKVVDCWIASEAGKNFSCHLAKPPNVVCGAYLHLDGTEVCSSVLRAEKNEVLWECLKITETTGRHFSFSPLNVTDGEISVTATVSGSKLMQNVGVIEMQIYRATVRGIILEKYQNKKKKEPPVLQIPEILAKGKVLHQVGFCDETEIESLVKNRTQVQPKYQCIYDTKEMLARFTFRYRPLDVLQRAGIAPRDPTPPQAPSKSVDTPMPIPRSPAAPPTQPHPIKRRLSAVDVKAEEAEVQVELLDDDDEYSQREKVLLAELEKLRNQRAVKKESVQDNLPRKKVKKEHRPIFTPGEVIDLT